LYLLAFDALGVSGDGDGRRALKLFDAYEGLSKDGLLPAPSVRLLSAVLVSLVRSPNQPLHEDAIAIYYRILRQFGEGRSTERMDSRTLITLIRSILGSSKEDARDLAMQVLDRTIAVARRSPDVVKLKTMAMNMILDGFAAKGFPDEAWSTFNLMSSLTDEGFDTFPDVTSYTSLAKALAAARTPRTMERLDVLVEQVMGMYEKGSLLPDIQLFDNVLIGYRNVWSLHIEASRRAYDLLTWLESLRGTDDKLAPGLGSYRAVCEALAKSKVSNSLKLLEDVYQRARDLSKAGIIDELDRELCYAAISGYARQHDNRSIEKAEEIIADMELLREQDKHSAGAPDVRVYNRLLFAYSSGDVVDLATRAFTLFSRMKNAYEQGSTSCKPNTHSYNAVSYFLW
jgi:pentatricopeptide repeat protein